MEEDRDAEKVQRDIYTPLRQRSAFGKAMHRPRNPYFSTARNRRFPLTPTPPLANPKGPGKIYLTPVHWVIGG
jgi:hypothetical protein